MRRDRVIGLMLPHSCAYYRRIVTGAARFAESRPAWRFVSIEPKLGLSTLELLRRVDAAIVCIASRRWYDLVRESRTRCVSVDCVVPDLPVPRVGVDNRLVACAAAQHFFECGLRSFAFVGHRRYLFSVEREHGFREAVEAAGRQVALYHMRSSFDIIMGCKNLLGTDVEPWLLSLPRPTGIFTADDMFGAEIIAACRSISLRVPEDMAVLGVDDDDLYCSITRPALSSVIVPAEAIGYRAAALIARWLEGGHALTQDVLFPPPGIAVRRSTDVLAINDPDVISAIRFVRENCDRPLRVTDVLRHVPVGRRVLERRVHQLLGISLGAELRRTRLEHAKRLLAQTDLSIAEVADKSGFSSFRHLADAFRRDVRQTPTAYRRASRGVYRTAQGH